MPPLSPEIVLRAFDGPPDKHNKWICNEDEIPTAIDFEDSTPGETDIEPLKINIEWFGQNFWLFPDGRKIYSFNEDYIKPLLDEPDYLTYHKRETAGGGFVLACKIGLELKAVVAPAMLQDNEKYAEETNRIAALYKSMERERVINTAYELFGEQDTDPPPEVDTDTGEVIDGQEQLNFEPESE
jgi:hypothetical protein